VTAQVELDDKYRLDCERALLSGRQALVRLPIEQRASDRRRGLNTAGLISGYRGSPLGGYDIELWRARDALEASNIRFLPGLNEDLALTALAGAQQLDFLPGRKVDGVFCLWYGKGPGVDRSGDAIKHANLQGVAAHGGVVLAFGDDHAAMSSTTAHQSDLTLASWGVPVLYPASVAEILQLGLAAFALSRYAGLLVGLKLVNETADATAVALLREPGEFLVPETSGPAGGVSIRPEPFARQEQDSRLVRYKLPRASVFANANRLDRVVFGADAPRLLIATSGKAYADVLGALELLGIDEACAREVGIGVYKIALLFPLDPRGLEQAGGKAEEIVFVEEKRPHAESQAKALLYNFTHRPRISGKTGPGGEPLLPADSPLEARIVAVALSRRLRSAFPDLLARLPHVEAGERRARASLDRSAAPRPAVLRRPAFCPGCPHNSSTQVPAGAFGATGIGCHGLAVFHRERNPLPMGHMGSEGAQWIGLAQFTSTAHIFQNLGDGTYNHSGSLAIRAAVQAGVSITYKILFNDAVAMTGGQPVEGALTVSRIVQQVHAEGVARVVVLSESPARFAHERLPRGTELRHRDELSLVQNELRSQSGVSVLIFDQVCAAEKRRRRRLEAFPDPDRRMFINEAVCEGCGDCSTQSNCLAIQPLETELGRKRRIDQSACNKDFSCAKGFCPAFVSVSGAALRKQVPSQPLDDAGMSEPAIPGIDRDFDLLIAGVGGTGVVTVSAILGMAARIDGLGAQICDMTGLSQKGGQVFSHVRLQATPGRIVAARIGADEADVVLACDLVAAVQREALETITPGKTRIVVNSDLAATADFQVNPDLRIADAALLAQLTERCGSSPFQLPASSIARSLLGDTIAANLLMLGYAWQRGLVPLSRSAIEQAIALNGRAVALNRLAFAAGRGAAIAPPRVPSIPSPASLDAFVAARTEDLQRYWNSRYAARYAELMTQVRAAAGPLADGSAFAWAVARGAYKVMAYKDEYEVARLYVDGRFRAALLREFEPGARLEFHMAPPLLSRRDRASGRPRKVAFGGRALLPFLRALAALRVLRESPLDLFARSADRALERELRDTYLRTVRALTAGLSSDNLSHATSMAELPLNVRGFGHVKAPAARAAIVRLLTIGRGRGSPTDGARAEPISGDGSAPEKAA
jgi:indolepyruvate ferredoxin oxidoreductase